MRRHVADGLDQQQEAEGREEQRRSCTSTRGRRRCRERRQEGWRSRRPGRGGAARRPTGAKAVKKAVATSVVICLPWARSVGSKASEAERQETRARAEHLRGPAKGDDPEHEREDHGGDAHQEARGLVGLEVAGPAAGRGAGQRVQHQDRHALAAGRRCQAATQQAVSIGQVVVLVVDETLAEAADHEQRGHDRQQAPGGRADEESAGRAGRSPAKPGACRVRERPPRASPIPRARRRSSSGRPPSRPGCCSPGGRPRPRPRGRSSPGSSARPPESATGAPPTAT